MGGGGGESNIQYNILKVQGISLLLYTQKLLSVSVSSK